LRAKLKALLGQPPGSGGFYLAHPAMAYYHHYMKKRGVELEPYV